MFKMFKFYMKLKLQIDKQELNLQICRSIQWWHW